MRWLLAALVLFVSSPAWAAWHLYVMPLTGTGTPRTDPRRPLYFAQACAVQCAIAPYGAQAIALVAADVDSATDAALAAQADVTKIPDNLDASIPAGALAAVQNALENRGIPGQWVTTSNTYRDVLRVALGAFDLLSRLSGRGGARLLSGAVDLSSTFNSLPAGVRSNLISAAADLNIDTSGFTGTSTLREILRGVGQQFLDVPRTLGGITI